MQLLPSTYYMAATDDPLESFVCPMVIVAPRHPSLLHTHADLVYTYDHSIVDSCLRIYRCVCPHFFLQPLSRRFAQFFVHPFSFLISALVSFFVCVLSFMCFWPVILIYGNFANLGVFVRTFIGTQTRFSYSLHVQSKIVL